MTTDRKITIGLCETQPLMIAGLKAILRDFPAYQLLEPVKTLDQAARFVLDAAPDVFLLDKSLGSTAVMEFVSRYQGRFTGSFAVWGALMTEPETLRFLKAGARGIIRKTSEVESILACVDTLTTGGSWVEEGLFQSGKKQGMNERSHLTSREQEVLELVEQGLRNKDIARELGIQTGTVKIHMKHIFEKTGVRGRYGLALTGLQQRAVEPMLYA